MANRETDLEWYNWSAHHPQIFNLEPLLIEQGKTLTIDESILNWKCNLKKRHLQPQLMRTNNNLFDFLGFSCLK